MYARYFKRVFDVFCALMAIMVFWWLYLIVALLVRIKLGSPVIFRQKRPGFKGKIFTLYKFRTMTDKKDAEGRLLPDEERLTRFGRLLRKTSLDELPEAFNILKGDMSVVGPRPLLVEYLGYYTEEEMHRHDTKPGLTGLAQINGRNAISWEEKFRYDLEYVDNITFMGDVRIIFSTVRSVLLRKGISSKGSATMEKFTGSKPKEREKVEI